MTKHDIHGTYLRPTLESLSDEPQQWRDLSMPTRRAVQRLQAGLTRTEPTRNAGLALVERPRTSASTRELVPELSRDPALRSRSLEILDKCDGLARPPHYLGTMDLPGGHQVFHGRKTDWVLVNAASDPLWRCGEFPVPDRVLYDLDRIVERVKFDTIWVAHEVPRGAAREDRRLELGALLPPPTLHNRQLSDRCGWLSRAAMMAVALPLLPLGLLFGATGLATVAGVAALDPILLGVVLPTGQQHRAPGAVGAWFYLSHWSYDPGLIVKTINLAEFLSQTTAYEDWRIPFDPRLRRAVLLAGALLLVHTAVELVWPWLRSWNVQVPPYVNALGLAGFGVLWLATERLQHGRRWAHVLALGTVVLGAICGHALLATVQWWAEEALILFLIEVDDPDFRARSVWDRGQQVIALAGIVLWILVCRRVFRRAPTRRDAVIIRAAAAVSRRSRKRRVQILELDGERE